MCAALRPILAEVPTHNVARRYLAAALGQLGRIDEAKAVIRDLLKSQPQSSLRSARSSGFGIRAWPNCTSEACKGLACRNDPSCAVGRPSPRHGSTMAG